MTPRAEHTPTPWRTNGATVEDLHGLAVADAVHEYPNAESRAIGHANAAFIVRAVNSHAALVAALVRAVEALREARRWIGTLDDDIALGSGMPDRLASEIQQARVVLAKLEEK